MKKGVPEASGPHIVPTCVTNYFIMQKKTLLLRDEHTTLCGTIQHRGHPCGSVRGAPQATHLSAVAILRRGAVVGLCMPAPNTGMARTVTRVGKGNSMIKDRSPNKTPRRRRPLSAAGLSATTVVLPLRLCWVLGVAHFGSLLCAGVQAPNTSPWLLRASALQRFLT